MRASLSTCRVLSQMVRRVVLGGGVPLVGPQEESCVARVDILPGGLLRAQHRRQRTDFRVYFFHFIGLYNLKE